MTDNGYIITIDGGTTNTRCLLFDPQGKKAAEAKRRIGVRDAAVSGSAQKLKQALKECLETLLRTEGIGYERIRVIIASGMITSDAGLAEIPHLSAPAGLEDLVRGTAAVKMREICPVPIYFVPGVKNGMKDVNLDNYASMDMMRGEEVECLAVVDRYFRGRPMLLILPGSHNKFAAIDGQGKIAGCLTTISGELLAAITNDTILAKSVAHRFAEEESYDREWMLAGYREACKTGLGRACFSGRILSLFVEKDPRKIANYLLGAVLQGDMDALWHSKAVPCEKDTDIVICGENPLRQAMIDLLEYEGGFVNIRCFVPEEGIPASAAGAYLVAKRIGGSAV